ncbi:WecB/TagA/CpsF family glycosyltransferase [Motilibacter aurantiacus]|uniref:WecB/TagA/CpsF family glycosyltransferase n=1 Tax=Motilibacter aurantiacus TaxID=2714955 RepID=UPI00140E038E|nr:WecB/TagA/CpsF family glycosyltransferase [Motilibacter aurantiacus]NHC46363.1 WecB/TagA/CpsF family glycosyltransferase [Motilibacter aurantiacus]
MTSVHDCTCEAGLTVSRPRTGELAALDRFTSFGFADVKLYDADVTEAAAFVEWAARAHTPLAVHMCNAYVLSLVLRRTGYREVLNHQSVNFPDGTPVAWFHRVISKSRAKGPVRGPALMQAVLSRPGLRHYLLGGSPEVLADLERAIKTDYPDAVVAGSLAPPFRDPTHDDVLEYAQLIEEAAPDLVWVGLGTPRQDQLIAQLVDHVSVTMVGVGAAFDFLSGHKKEAPAALHGTGFEWVHRLVSEPRRLWKRYLLGNALFLLQAGREVRKLRNGQA